MSRYPFSLIGCVVTALTLTGVGQARAREASSLRLVPFPKETRLDAGRFALDGPLVLEVRPELAGLMGQLIGDELQRTGAHPPEVRPRRGLEHALLLSTSPGGPPPKFTFRPGATPEDYVLQITPDTVTVDAPGAAGQFYGVQTLRQVIRANSQNATLPCLLIHDWPLIKCRGFQDDMTRGPSSTLETLQREVAIGAGLKMNLFAYYMEYQYAFKKHPAIGPKDGSLTPGELRALVAYATPYHVGILGSQQSFGHFHHILKHDKPYLHLRETPNILCPMKEESYQLLDDLYSEVIPLLPLPFFNVCCDETQGLGTGPSKALAAKIGVGGVYARHMHRLYELLKTRYGKRMMMWGDIILNHPEHLKEIPTDTIMLTWNYSPADSFEKQIIPFARSGYEFFVCPGVSCWNRILPDFSTALVNIRNFVRDGAKHGAIGVLNTAWDDNGETFNAPNWHGYAWGAECAWNASSTTPEDFNRRVGAVLFGEKEDHFGRAIELLAKTHSLPGMDRMFSGRFWEIDLAPPEAARRDTADRLLEIVRPAIEHLQACRNQATVNADLLDYFLFAARRMELIGRRMLARHEAVAAYEAARESDLSKAGARLDRAEATVRELRDAHEALGRQFQELWLRENKPFALDWTMARFQRIAKSYHEIAEKLAAARANAAAGEPLPDLEDVGLVRSAGKP